MSRFNWVQVLALDVLNQGKLQHGPISHVLNHNRDFLKLGHFGGAPSSLAGYDLVSIAEAADNQWLNDSVGANGCCEFLQAIGIEVGPGLHRIGLDLR